MAHRQYTPPRGAAELDTSGRSQLDGEIFEMPGESMMPRPEGQTRKPVQAQDGDAVQANPWPFYLDQDVRTESRVDVEEEKKPGKADAKSEEQQPLANPWPYFGPMSPGEEEDGPKASIAAATAAGPGVGGSGIKAEESRTAEAKIEDVSAAPPPLHLSSSHNKPAGDGTSPASPAPLPPATSESSSPPAPFYIAPLKLSRKQVPAAAAAPTFKPYLPPEESVAPVVPLSVKPQRPSDGPYGDGATTLPYRPYRPAGHEDEVVTASTPPVAPQPTSPPPPPAQSHGPPAVGAVPPQASPQAPPQAFPQAPPAQAVASQAAPQGATTWAGSASPDLAKQQQQQQQPQQPQQHPVIDSPGSAEAPLAGVMPPQPQYHQPNQLPPPAATGPPPLPPPLPPSLPPAAPPIQQPVPVVAVANHPPIAAPTPYHNPQPPVPPHPAPTGTPYQPLPSPSNPSPVTGYPHPIPSPSHPSPAIGHPPTSSPIPGQPAYGPPNSAPTSSVPSPQMASFQFQPMNQTYPQNLYPVPTPTPPVASQAPPAPVSYPPAQHFTPPPPTSGYDIPQPTYASSTVSSPPQPPRPDFQQAAMGAYQQYPPPQPSPTYGYAGAPRPGTLPPSATYPSAYNAPYGPAIAPHQHQYPTQATYAAADGNIPSSPNLPQGQYVSPPLPPRPATTQPQFFAGFTSQNVVAYPPPPKRVFSPPPAAPPQPPRRQSGGTSSGRLFSSSSALKWIDKTGKGLENKLDAVLGSQGSSNRPPPQPPRPS